MKKEKRNRDYQKVTSKILATLMIFSLILSPSVLADAKETSLSKGKLTRVSVHDPSIFESNGTYYALGSHVASAKSSDLMHWEQVSTDYQNVDNEPFYGDLSETFKEPFQWAGYNDGDAANGGYAVWAPDIIWNPHYVWDDGSKGAYMLYCCTSSTWRRSCIVYLVSKTMDGTYEYGDTIIYSGFTKTGNPDGNSTRNTRWDNNYLNLKELVSLGAKNGGIDAISDNWFTTSGDWNNLYAPNAIDPTVFFGADGKFYMTYGSWSGGLFILELDSKTGKPIYPGVDSIDPVSGNFVDRYFGTHIAGGNHESGEAPYILYDEETQYYYLYETYGGLTATGGYNMRLFRSKNVTGPYLDAAGRNAAESGSNNDLYGVKLIGNYQFHEQRGKRAAGHNSAMIDKDGSRYLVYHQRFNDSPINEGHELRVHQQFLNESGWPVTAVYEYSGEQPTHYNTQEVVGIYEFVNHGNDSTGNMLPTENVILFEDGSIGGDYTGTWEKKSSSYGYDSLTMKIGNVVYEGYFFRQSNEADSPKQVMTFSAIGNDNTSIWGSMMDDSAETLVSVAASSLDRQVPTSVRENISLPSSIMGASISWSSSRPDLLSPSGQVHSAKEDTVVTLTATISKDQASITRTYTITVQAMAKLIYQFDFNTKNSDRSFSSTINSSKQGKAVIQGSVSHENDQERGRVIHIVNEAGSKGVNYLKLPSDTFSDVTDAGFSVSMWVNVGKSTFDHSALFEANLNNTQGMYPMTRIGANLLARINANGYSDVQNELLHSNGYRDQWEKVVYTVNPNGVRVYLNGVLVGEEQKDLSGCFDSSNAFSIQKAAHVALGNGVIFGDEDVRNVKYDDVEIYSGILTADEVLASYNADIQ